MRCSAEIFLCMLVNSGGEGEPRQQLYCTVIIKINFSTKLWRRLNKILLLLKEAWLQTQCAPRVCTNYRTILFFFNLAKSSYLIFLFWQTFSLLCSKHTLGSYSTLIKKNIPISWSAQILFLICFITTTQSKTGQYLYSGLEGDAGAIAIRH